jgi:hypothetical protein
MNQHYRRRSLGQRLIDAIGTAITTVIFLGPVLAQIWQDRKAARR